MSELIDRKAAIRATWQEPSYTDPVNVLTEVRDRINALPTIPVSHWHRVEEEPRESGKQYVVWASKGYAYCDKWLGDRWLISSVAPETVTHWMPIEPPKEE